MTKVEKFLSEKLGYEQYEIDITLEDIEKMDEESQSVLERYIDGEDVSEYSEGDYSVGRLIKDKGFNVVAAIISISNLKVNYEKYDAMYKRPIK